MASSPAFPALASCSACPTLAPVAASVSRPSSTTWAWPSHPSPYSAPALQFPLWDARERLEAVHLRGGYVRNPGWRFSLSPPEVAFSLPPGLIPHTCHSSHRQLFPIITVFIFPSHSTLCLVSLYMFVYMHDCDLSMYANTYNETRQSMCLYVFVYMHDYDLCLVYSLGHQHCVAICGVPFLYNVFCFCLVDLFVD